jgi:hypothetical protein
MQLMALRCLVQVSLAAGSHRIVQSHLTGWIVPPATPVPEESTKSIVQIDRYVVDGALHRVDEDASQLRQPHRVKGPTDVDDRPVRALPDLHLESVGFAEIVATLSG